MKYSYIVIIMVYLLLHAESSTAQERTFGLGVIIGEPTGISAKLWTSNANAFDFGLGWSIGGDRIGKYHGYYNGTDRIHFHMDYLWHSFNTFHSTERFPLYYGIGGHLNSGAGYERSIAIRGVFGVAWLPHHTPIDVFLELVPSLQLISTSTIVVDAGFGIRYFF